MFSKQTRTDFKEKKYFCKKNEQYYFTYETGHTLSCHSVWLHFFMG